MVGNSNDTTIGNRAQHGTVPGMPEARRDRPCRYTIDELMQLRYVANLSFDQLNVSPEAPIGKSFLLLVSACASVWHPHRLRLDYCIIYQACDCFI